MSSRLQADHASSAADRTGGIDDWIADLRDRISDHRWTRCEIIRAKRSGKEVHHAAEVEEEAPPDLLEALRASIEAAGGRRGRSRASSDGRSRDLAGLSKAELDERARKANIRGRSKMSKDELIEALRAA